MAASARARRRALLQGFLQGERASYALDCGAGHSPAGAELLLHLRLDRLGGAQDRARLEEIEHAEDADVRPQQRSGAPSLSLSRHDGVAHHRDRREQALPRIGHAAALPRRRPTTSTATIDVGLAAQALERQRIDRAAVDQHPAVVLDRPHQAGHRHRGRDAPACSGPSVNTTRFARVQVGRRSR